MTEHSKNQNITYDTFKVGEYCGKLGYDAAAKIRQDIHHLSRAYGFFDEESFRIDRLNVLLNHIDHAHKCWNRQREGVDIDTIKFECTKGTADEAHIRVIFNVLDYLNRTGLLRTTPEDAKGDGWQPIETAPRDKVFCVWMPFGTMYTQCRWREDRGCAENHFGLLPEATHWTIPHGPTTQQPEREGE